MVHPASWLGLESYLRPFDPLFRNPHLATLAGNFWSRPDGDARWPVEEVRFTTEPGVDVLVHSQKPEGAPKAELLLIHVLEGSSQAGYARSMANEALSRGYAVDRLNMRGCGGTEHLLKNFGGPLGYHAGLTSDVLAVVREIRQRHRIPVFVVGFSLGGNVALKLAGELGESGTDLLAGVGAVSTPIDLGACAERLGHPSNFLYENRFLDRMKARIRLLHQLAPDRYTLDHLPKVRTIIDFDNFYTAPTFGFGTAANYFRTQSANQFLERIRVPTLVIQAKDDPLIPFNVYNLPVFSTNPSLSLLAVDHGGHLGFLARRKPRFWVDQVMLEWIAGRLEGH